MTPAAIVAAASALGATVSEASATALLAYLTAMLTANRNLNLTGVRDPAQAEVLHVLDSIAVQLAGLHPVDALDLGSGNGFPGVAVAALWPDAEVTLMDRTGKKTRALRQLVATAGLDNVTTENIDAAQVPALRKDLLGRFDLVTARAVGAPATVADLTAALTAPGGHLVLWLDKATPAPAKAGSFELLREVAYALPEPAPRERRLAVYYRECR